MLQKIFFGLLLIAFETQSINWTEVDSLPFVSREEWGARPAKVIEKFSGEIGYVIIHHSYIPDACYTTEKCSKAMQDMQIFHQDDRGWNDIGYSFAVGGDGMVYAGRGFNVVGAHAPGFNDKSVGICLIGDWRIELPPESMLNVTQDLIKYAIDNGIISENYKLLGHRQVRDTECPGDRLYKEIQSWPHYSREP